MDVLLLLGFLCAEVIANIIVNASSKAMIFFAFSIICPPCQTDDKPLHDLLRSAEVLVFQPHTALLPSAASPEGASCRHIQRTGSFSFDFLNRFGEIHSNIKNRANQCPRVGMNCMLCQILCRQYLHYISKIHHCHLMSAWTGSGKYSWQINPIVIFFSF